MKISTLFLILLSAFLLLQCEKEEPATGREKPLYMMVSSDIDDLLAEQTKGQKTVRERILFNSRLGLNTPYLIFGLGEGPLATYDPDPLYDLARVDCMTFCEQILALSISEDFHSFFWALQKIRYRQGQIGFTTRNHYTVIDWLPANSWLLHDATEDIGGKLCKSITKTIDQKKFFLKAGVPDSPELPDPVTLKVTYIPKDKLLQIQDRFHGAEIVSMITTHPAVFSSHMGIIAFDDEGNPVFRNASSRKKYRKVVDIPFGDFVNSLLDKDSNLGLLFMRVNYEDTPSPFSKKDFLEIALKNQCRLPKTVF